VWRSILDGPGRQTLVDKKDLQSEQIHKEDYYDFTPFALLSSNNSWMSNSQIPFLSAGISAAETVAGLIGPRLTDRPGTGTPMLQLLTETL
jgi:hypothetical protein